MATMQPALQQVSKSNRALLLMLVFGNLFFFSCVTSRYFQVPAKWSPVLEQPVRIALIGD
jgi:hypothetical protein